jgi:pimeloyl-ACP methyl ester carboxylesterase
MNMTQAGFATAPDGVRLGYDITGSGEGPPLLCLPGLTRNRDDFATVVDDFSDRVQVIRMDFRGRGASDHADPATYQVPQEAADVLTLLDHLGLDRVTILGTSRGGLVAMGLAVAAPDRLAGVIFNDVGPEIMPEGLQFIFEYLGKPPKYRTMEEATAGLARQYGTDFDDVPQATWAAMARAIFVESGDGLALRYDPKLRDAVLRDFGDGRSTVDLWPFYDALAGKPLGLIRGVHSNILSAETAAEMQRRRPDLIYKDVPKRGHVPFLDEPESRAVIATVLEQIA